MQEQSDDGAPRIPARGRAVRGRWLLEEGVAHLNHGSFGATPRPVLAAQDRWRIRAERQPVRFFVEEAPSALRGAAAALAAFVGARGEDLAFVENTTAGMGAILQSLDLRRDDSVVATSHMYPAVQNALRFVCARAGAHLEVADVPYPVTGPEAFVAALDPERFPRARVLVLDHVTSMTGLILPVARIAQAWRAAGVPVLVDGAHAPGMLDLQLPDTGADWYVGNCHKWLCSAKGCGLLWRSPTSPFAQELPLHPPVISHGLGDPFPAEFDWVGTRDLSSWLSIQAALDFHELLGGAEHRRLNRALARQGADLLAGAWGVSPPAPDAMFGSMAVVPLPGVHADTSNAGGQRVASRLRAEHRVEVAVTGFAGKLWCRVSAQAYNDLSDYQRLADAVRA